MDKKESTQSSKELPVNRTSTRDRAESSGIRFATNDAVQDATSWAFAKHAKVFKKLAE